ncbi:MAG: hypothetical protein KF687_07030 [Cyclobacteriaceae bacterium]|nr:hypothetical protein [Cyclobacteriaceae bacterium]
MRVFALILSGLVIMSCQESQPAMSEFTGNEVTYALQPGSEYPISGLATFKERKDGSTSVIISLDGTEGNILLPVHLHLGDISAADADVAAWLNPVAAKNGGSETHLNRLADETPISYNELKNLSACIKIHLAEIGPDRDVVLAGGNIGSAVSLDGSRTSMGVCKSE